MSILSKKSINTYRYGRQTGHFMCKIGHFNGKNYYIEDILRLKRTFYETQEKI